MKKFVALLLLPLDPRWYGRNPLVRSTRSSSSSDPITRSWSMRMTIRESVASPATSRAPKPAASRARWGSLKTSRKRRSIASGSARSHSPGRCRCRRRSSPNGSRWCSRGFGSCAWSTRRAIRWCISLTPTD